MGRRRNIPALIGTVALIAGCGSSTRAEVTGIVRDARTRRAIAGARVVAQHGAATRTDGEGRFKLAVSRGVVTHIRASAAGRCDARAGLEVRSEGPTTIELELEPCEGTAGRAASTSEVVSFDAEALGGIGDPDAVLCWIDDLAAPFARRVREAAPLDDAPHATAQPGAEIWSATEQWTLGAMDLLGNEAQLEPECAHCHDASAFLLAQGAAQGRRTACAVCHDDGSQRRFGLRIYENPGPIAGVPTPGLGTGAVCVPCHSAGARAPHAPQAEVLLGRGNRLAVFVGETPHGAIADSCVACHAGASRSGNPETITLGHTFAVRDAQGAIAPDACSACHGEVDPDAIGARDWDGDGIVGSLAGEYDRALRRARTAVDRRIRGASVRSDRCPGSGPASTFTESNGELLLVEGNGILLGDCDRDGVVEIARGERAVGLDLLPADVRDAAWDLAMIERDGSRGVHHPEFAFAVLDAIATMP